MWPVEASVAAGTSETSICVENQSEKNLILLCEPESHINAGECDWLLSPSTPKQKRAKMNVAASLRGATAPPSGRLPGLTSFGVSENSYGEHESCHFKMEKIGVFLQTQVRRSRCVCGVKVCVWSEGV